MVRQHHRPEAREEVSRVEERGPLSEIAYRALVVTQRRAEAEGVDLFEELNRYGLIASEPRIKELQVAALLNMVMRLRMLSADELLQLNGYGRRNSNPPTLDDLLQAVDGWISTYIEAVKKQ